MAEMDANRLQELCKKYGFKPVEGKWMREYGFEDGAVRLIVVPVVAYSAFWPNYMSERDLEDFDRSYNASSAALKRREEELETHRKEFKAEVDRILRKFGPKDYKLAAVEDEGEIPF